MNRDRHLFFTLAVIYDAALTAAAWVVCYLVRFRLGWLPHAADASTTLGEFLKILPVILACNAVALGYAGLYRPEGIRSVFRERIQIAKGALLGWVLMVAALYYVSTSPYSRVLMGIFLFVNPLSLTASRIALRLSMRAVHRRGWGVRRAAIIGTGKLAQKALHGLRHDPWLGVHVEYVIKEDDADPRTDLRGVPVLGSAAGLLDTLRAHPVDTVYVAVRARKAGRVEHILDDLAKLPVSVAVIPDFLGVVTLSTGVDELAGLPLIRLVDTPVRGWYAVIKRAIDVVGSIMLLAIFGLPMLILAALVKLTSAGPVLYLQVRMGLGGKPFTMLKFRSMRLDAEEETGPVWAGRDDPRCTRLGRFMRRTSLDELPQLLNVLVGNMSLVGPRPERPNFVEEFTQTLPAYMLRHNVKAGMTGWAQVNGLRGQTSLKKRLQYDLYYINNWSLGFDLYILLRTPFVGFIHPNAQ
jgi:exopolysaccharide biosynthesis polyprenyl glycosylphosphotransferase